MGDDHSLFYEQLETARKIDYLIPMIFSHFIKIIQKNIHKKDSGGGEEPAVRETHTTHVHRHGEAEGCKLEVVLNTLSEAVLAADEKLILNLANPKARELFNIDTRYNGLSLLNATRSTELEALARRVLDQNNSIEKELKFYTDGETRYFQVSASPLNRPEKSEKGEKIEKAEKYEHYSKHKKTGEREGLVIVLADITRLRKLEQVRKDFAANVSHELRTPIQLIKGYAETLADYPLEDADQVRRFIGIILKNAKTMENLTTDLLSLVSLEEGGIFPFDMKETLIYPLLQEALCAVEPSAQKKDINVSLQCPPELSAVLYGQFIIQAVINLLDNAVKYSPEGSQVWVEASSIPPGAADPSELVIAVRDQGIGIPPNHLGRIFERFYRVDRARSRDQGGTGLGLAIVRHIAMVHRGTASAESHAGEGSVFRIHIPLAPDSPSDFQQPLY